MAAGAARVAGGDVDFDNRLVRTKVAIGVFLCLAIGMIALIAPTSSSAASARYAAFNVDLTVQNDGSFRVRETQVVTFNGSLSHGFREIPETRTNGIRDVQISELRNGQIVPYRETSAADARETPDSFGITNLGGSVYANWTFAPTKPGDQRTFLVDYVMVDALRSYPANVPPVQQVWWTAVGSELTGNTPVDGATVSVTLPSAVTLANVTVSTNDVQGKPADHSSDGRVFTWTHGAFGSGDELTIRMQFPPVVANYGPPSWQTTDDAQRLRAEQSNQRQTAIHLAEAGIALLLTVGGGILLWALWYAKGRDPHTGLVAEFLSEPPDDLPAGVVGTLLDEHAEMRDIVAMTLDLARRGIVKLTLVDRPGPYGGTARAYVYEVVEPAPALSRPEQTVFKAIFGSAPKKGQQVALDTARRAVAAAFPQLQLELYDELVHRGLMAAAPQRVRARWRNTAIGVAAIAVVGGAIGIWELDWWVLVPAVAAIGFALSIARMGKRMPRKTRQGAEAAAKWLAFKRYLAGFSRYERVPKSQEIFERNIAFATAFGLDAKWVSRFATSDLSVPGWLDLDPPQRRQHRGGGDVIIWGGGGSPGHGHPVGSGGGGLDLPDVDLPDLQDMSKGAAKGIQSGSSGAMSLLNVAGAILEIAAAFAGGSHGGSSGGGGGGFS